MKQKKEKLKILMVAAFLACTIIKIQANETMTKHKGIYPASEKTEGAVPPVDFDYDDTSGTIHLEFNDSINYLEVNIYKDGNIVYSDKDNADKNTYIDYVIEKDQSEEDNSPYCVEVKVNGETIVEEILPE